MPTTSEERTGIEKVEREGGEVRYVPVCIAPLRGGFRFVEANAPTQFVPATMLAVDEAGWVFEVPVGADRRASGKPDEGVTADKGEQERAAELLDAVDRMFPDFTERLAAIDRRLSRILNDEVR